jgi:hypothetical protein
MLNKKYYVYIHQKLTDGKCFYVGKGTKDRYKNLGGRNQHWHNVANKHGFKSIIIVSELTEEKAFELESIICNQIGYKNLVNIRTENGWGGYTMSETTKNKIRKKLKGKTISTETKDKISQANTGKKRSEEFKTQVKDRQKGHSCYQNIERNQKISQSNQGKKRSEETINKMKKPKPPGFGDQFKNREVSWGDKISQNRIGKGGKHVSQYDKQGNLIASFPTAKEAAEYIGVNPVNMIHHLNGKYKTCKNFIFKYKI